MPHDTTQGRQHRASKIQSRRKAGTAAGVCSVILAVGAVAATSGADPAGSATLTPQPIASDAFGRTVASGLGTADLGGAYSVMAPSNVGVSVSGARASFTSIRPGQSIAATLPATGTDEQMRTSIVVPKFNSSTGPLYFGVELRRQADGRGYRASVGIDPSGKLTLGLSRLGVNRAETSLAYKTLTLKVTPGQVLDLEGLVSGSAPVGLSVRAWLDGTAVPAWQLTYNDSAGTLPQTGSIGEWAYLSSSGATLGFQQTALAAWNLVAAAPAPAPAPTTSSTTTSPAPTTSSTTSSPAPSPTSSSVAPTSSATATSAPAPSPTSTTTSAPAPSPTTTTTSAPAPAPTTSSTTTSPAPAPAPTPTSIFDQNYDSLPVSDPVSVATERAALGDPTLNLGSSNLGRTSIIATPDHGNVMRITMPANTIGEASGAIIDAKLPQTVDQASISYDIRFNSTFDWSLGGKLPGLGGAVPGTAASTAGGCVAGNSGAWSGRGMWITPGSYPSVTGANEIIGYTYDYAKQSACGDNQRTNAALTAGAWHTIKMTYRMNTIAANGTPNADGVFKMWIDGTLVKDVENFLYRNNTDLHINYLYWEIFRGGGTQTWAAPTTGTIDFDNLHITTS